MTQKYSDRMGRWALGHDEIGTDGTTYMRRWFFWCPWFGVRVHHILRSDPDRHMHDHPWDFMSLLLTGGYTEVVPRYSESPSAHCPNPRKIHHPRWSVLRHKAEDLHRLVLDKPVWTLVFTGHKRKSWGFATERGMVPWRQYLQEGGHGSV